MNKHTQAESFGRNVILRESLWCLSVRGYVWLLVTVSKALSGILMDLCHRPVSLTAHTFTFLTHYVWTSLAVLVYFDHMMPHVSLSWMVGQSIF